MLRWFCLGTFYQSMQNSDHYQRTAALSYSVDLIKLVNVTPNMNQPESSEINERIKVRTSISYSAQSQIHAAGRDMFRNKI